MNNSKNGREIIEKDLLIQNKIARRKFVNKIATIVFSVVMVIFVVLTYYACINNNMPD